MNEEINKRKKTFTIPLDCINSRIRKRVVDGEMELTHVQLYDLDSVYLTNYLGGPFESPQGEFGKSLSQKGFTLFVKNNEKTQVLARTTDTKLTKACKHIHREHFFSDIICNDCRKLWVGKKQKF